MDYLKKTLEYYSKWLGEEQILLRDFEEVQYVYSTERNEPQYGYGEAFDLYIFIKDKKMVVSYGDKMQEKINELKKNLKSSMSTNDIKSLISKIYDREPKYNIKYVFSNINPPDNKAIVLNKEHYMNYADFFRKCNANCSNIDWLEEYFNEMIQENLCVGAFDREVLVSCSDAPGMPYMSNEVQEIGINTLPEYRGKGYATSVCKKCIYEILGNGKVPQWSTSANNIASQRLAEKSGFVKLADVITLSL
ncbi:MAG: GNAT family N-acetyltransferase [Ruminiclostridium sp.]|nr:GNAT family N-acetyltransferase [Ruminiclostridium sp.]